MTEQDDVMSEFMGLNEKQLQVYSLILTLGQVTTGDIAIVMGSEAEEVQITITELERLKLITALPGIVPRYQAIPPFDELVKEVSTISEKIEKLREELKEQLRSASMTVRDSLFELAKESLEKVELLTSQHDADKSKAIENVSSMIGSWSESSKKVIEDSTSTIGASIEKEKGSTSKKIDSVFSTVRDGLVSQGDAFSSEIQSWASSTKSVSESLKSGLTSHINGFQEKAVQILDDQHRTIFDTVSAQLETTSSDLEKSKIVQLEQLEILKDSTTETLTSLPSQITHVLSDAQNSIGKSVESVSNRLSGELESVRQTFTEAIHEHSTADETAISEFNTGFETSLDDYASKHNQVVEEAATSIESVTSNLSTQSQSACSSLSQQVDGFARRSQDQMENAMGSMHESSVNTIQDVFKVTNNASTSLLGETETQLSSEKEKLQNAMDETSESIKSLNQRSLEMHLGLLNKTRNAIGQQLGEIAERTKSRIEKFANTTLEDLEALKQSLQEQITQAVAKSSEQIRAVTTSASNEIDQGVETQIHQLGTRLEEQLTEYRTMHDTMTTNIDETITNHVKQHSEMIDNLLNRTTSLHEEMIDEIDTFRRHAIGDLETKLNDSKTTAADSILHMRDESVEIIRNMETLLQETIEATSKKSKIAVTGLRSATDTYTNSLRESCSGLITGMKTWREQLRNSLVKSVESSVMESQTRLRNESMAALQTLAEKSDEIKTSTQAEMDSVGEKGTTLLKGASEEVAKAFDSASSTVTTTLDEVKDNLSDSLAGLKTDLAEHSASLLNQLESSVSELESTIDTGIGERQTSIDAANENAKNEIDSFSEKLKTTLAKTADSLKSESIKAVTTSMKSAVKSVEGMRSELESSLSTGYDGLGNNTAAVRNALNRLLSKLEESPMLGLTENTLDEAFAAPVEGAGSDAAAVLSKVWERVGATDFPGAKDFWTVSTRSAVLAHISDMVQKAKSKITLILAYPNEIPTEMLVELKSTIGVEVCVTEGGMLADKARPLVGRGNIRVRTRTETDVYACVRDSEEVLLAPVSKDDRDVIGIATEDPGFVKFVMGVVGPIFQAKTKLLRPGDI